MAAVVSRLIYNIDRKGVGRKKQEKICAKKKGGSVTLIGVASVNAIFICRGVKRSRTLMVDRQARPYWMRSVYLYLCWDLSASWCL